MPNKSQCQKNQYWKQDKISQSWVKLRCNLAKSHLKINFKITYNIVLFYYFFNFSK